MTRRLPLPLLACAGLILASPGLFAQQIGSNSTQTDKGPYTLSVTSQLVVETVVAKDKQGHFINGLSAKDFSITEDGVPQKIRFCEHETLPTDAEALPPLKDEDENITIYKRLTRTSIAQEDTERDTGKSRYQGHRLIALYFDMTTMRPEDQLRAIDAAETFIRTQMTAVDLVSIMRYQGGSVDVLQDFYLGPQPAAEHPRDDGRRRRAGLADCDRRLQQRGHRRGVRAGRQRVQCLQYRSPAFRAADRGADAWRA